MSERKWTQAQLDAINFKGKNLILSAAAGSGKTATLTERIIRLLKDEESGAQLSRMLIVTFTTAAAGELKSRIADALTAAMAESPNNLSLARQLAALEGAHISTIDSFFKSELRPYFSEIGMPPDFGILDEAEAAILRTEAMKDVIAAQLEKKNEVSFESFSALADSISTARNESDLCESLLNICQDLLSYDISSEALLACADELEHSCDDFLQSDYCIPVKKAVMRLYRHYLVKFLHFEEALALDEDTEKYLPEVKHLLDICGKLENVCEASYDEAKEIFDSIEFSRLAPIKRGKESEEYELFKEARNGFKAEIGSLRNDYFLQSSEEIAEAMCATAAHVRTLSVVNDCFVRAYGEEKRQRGVCDFADLATFARKIFVSPDGTPTKAAVETGKKFDYVFIDEYQDTNPVQDDIFSAISSNSKRFMVGDVKQSIYGFRGSRPELFTGYRERYADGNSDTALFMSENFRSDSCVIDFANVVSQHIFKASGTPFEEEDKLVSSKVGGNSDNKCEVILVEAEGDDENEVMPTEAECVAARISELIANEKLSSGEPVHPKDIAILLRSGVNADEFAHALTERGIPVSNSASEDFFDYGEVLVVLCLLNCADNPLRDIYLAGAMKSPFFGFTLNDLVNVRKTTSVPLWYSLCRYCDEGDDGELLEKCRHFKATVEKWRERAKELYADEMLRLIVADTSLRSYGGDKKRKNSDVIRSLKVLSEHAAYVSKQGGTLHELIAHLNSVIERKDKATAFSDPDSVTILTIHKSKGLEYPVCFLCEGSKRFNNRDISEKLLIAKSGKVGMKLYDKKGLVRCDNPLRRAVALEITEEAYEEQARVLYVAMTRARERFIVSCKVKSMLDRFSHYVSENVFPPDRYDVLSRRTYADWIIDALHYYGDGSFYVYKKGAGIKGADCSSLTKNCSDTEYLRSFFEKSLDFSYDKEYLWNIPAKLSVSVLKPDTLGSDEEKAYFEGPSIITMAEKPALPAFLDTKKKADGAARGTATHEFMQFCNFERLKNEGVQAELSRLVENRFISKDSRELVRTDELMLFQKSALFSRLLSAKKILREQRFNTILPACDFTLDPELYEKLKKEGTTITVQGVVDCIFIDSDGKAVLVDYKTDRLSPEELEDETKAENLLLSRHSRQLRLYSKVCEQMIGRPFDEVSIYSLPLGRTITLK